MSGILQPFEGSGDSQLAPDNTFISMSSTMPVITQQILVSPSLIFIMNASSTTIPVHVEVQDDQSNTSIRNHGSPLSLWVLAVLVVGTTVLLSLSLVCVTLLVGWKKSKRRRNYQVNLRSRPHHSSSLWIDLECRDKEVPVECTDARLQGNIRRECSDYCRHKYGFNTLPVMHMQHGIGLRNAYFNEDMCDDDRLDSSPKRRSQSLPRKRMHKPTGTSVNRQHSFLHLQPATTSTFKLATRETGQDDIDLHIDKALTFNSTNMQSATVTSTLSNSPEEKIDISDIPSLNLIDDHEEPDLDSPVRIELLARDESVTVANSEEEEELPPTARVVYFDNHNDISVTTFKHYAFNTL